MAAPRNKRGKGSTEAFRRAQAELMWSDRSIGLTNRQIADKHEVSLRTVTNRFEEFPKEGLELSRGQTVHATGNDVDVTRTETAAMWDDKVNGRLSNEQLAEKYGVSTATVKKRLNGYFPNKTMIELEKHRLREDDKRDMLEEEVRDLMNNDHYVVDKGQVIMDPFSGQPRIDSEPKVKAVDRMLKIIEAKRKMFGLDSPVKAEVKHTTDATIQVQEVSDAVAEAHRKNHERLAQIQKNLGIETREIEDAELVGEAEEAEVLEDEGDQGSV